MFVAMNRFKIALGREQEFIDIWKNRESHLDGVPGFKEFHLLRGASDDNCTLFASHSIWESRAAFEVWTKSEAFRRALALAGAACVFFLGLLLFVGFVAVLCSSLFV